MEYQFTKPNSFEMFEAEEPTLEEDQFIEDHLDQEFGNLASRASGNGISAAGKKTTIVAYEIDPYSAGQHKVTATRRTYEVTAAEANVAVIKEIIVAAENTCCTDEDENACEDTNGCANGWPSMQIRVSGNENNISWMGETWTRCQHDWRCVCPTDYDQSRITYNWPTSPDTTVWRGSHFWRHNNSLYLVRFFTSSNSLSGSRVGGFNKASFKHAGSDKFSEEAWWSPTGVPIQSAINPLNIIGQPRPSKSAYLLLPAWFGSHIDTNGVTFEWRPGVGWPV